MGQFLSKALSILVGLAIIWFGVSPYWAFFAIRSAAQSNDAARMGELIDYPKVKQSLRDQIDPAHAARPAPNVWEDPIGALRRSLEPLQPSPTADSYLTPQAVAGLTMGRWAWGSNFIDLNNDGWEDIYVANGFMSAPDTGDL